MPSAFAQEESTCYELSAMNFHLGETPPRELWEREQTERVATLLPTTTRVFNPSFDRRASPMHITANSVNPH
jgi:hypothetical protein